MVERRGQPKVSAFVEISISHKVIHYCNHYNESPFKAWKRLIKHRVFRDLMKEHFKKDVADFRVDKLINDYDSSKNFYYKHIKKWIKNRTLGIGSLVNKDLLKNYPKILKYSNK